jgi:hypothetical protein
MDYNRLNVVIDDDDASQKKKTCRHPELSMVREMEDGRLECRSMSSNADQDFQ